MSTRSATWTGIVCKCHQLLLRAYKRYLLFQKNLKMLWTITMFLRELTSSAICACSALEHHDMDIEIFSSWGLRSLPAGSAEIVRAVNHNHLSLSAGACFTFSFLIVCICLTHCYTYLCIFSAKEKAKPKIILWSRSLITVELYKSPNIYRSLTMPCLDQEFTANAITVIAVPLVTLSVDWQCHSSCCYSQILRKYFLL